MKTHRWASIVALCALLLTASSTASQLFRAESARSQPRIIRSIDTNDFGLLNPASLTYSPQTGLFYVLSSRQDDGKTNLYLMTPFKSLEAVVTVDIQASGLPALAFDERHGRLLFLDAASGTMTSVPMKEDGLPAAVAPTRSQLPVREMGLLQPHDMVIDPVTGDLYVLDRGRGDIVRIDPASRATVNVSGVVAPQWLSRVKLDRQEATGFRGIALHPETRNLFLMSSDKRNLYELTQAGKTVQTWDLSALGLVDPQGMVFAPSADTTDDPEILNLFIADTGLTDPLDPYASQSSNNPPLGRILETSFTPPPTLQALTTVQATLERVTQTSQFTPPSPDPAGIVYLAHLDTLLISDSEVNEMPNLFTGKNLFMTSRAGTLLNTYSTIAFSDEPTGLAYDPATGLYYISDDNRYRVWELNPGPDGLLNTSDDIIRYFKTSAFGSQDPEGITFDPWQRRLFIVDGTNEEIYAVSPGANGQYDGVPPTGDDQMVHFDTTALGIADPESVEFCTTTGHLYIMASRSKTIAETTTDGTLIRYISFSSADVKMAAGLAYAPLSSDISRMGFYIVDRNVDNNENSSENDGRLFELSFPPLGGPVNQPPTVNAGLDQTVTLPQAATLSGTVTDDGLPDPPAAVSTLWSMVSGPAAVAFANPAAVATTATFSASGIYVLRLTADDGAQNSFDELIVTVNAEPPVNQPPTVNAGVDQTVTLPQAAILGGSVTDDGLPNPPGAVSTLWSKVSGPGTVTFANPAAAATTATFSASGTYVLRLTANDGALNASDELTVTVNPQSVTNQPPAVNAGVDQSVTLPQAGILNGIVTDDGLPIPPSAVSTLWSKVSGPGTVTFANPAAAATSVTFSASGTYILRLTANDGDLTAYDELTVTVYGTGNQVTVEVRVANGADDGEEGANGNVDITSSDLELVDEDSNQTVGIRFAGLTVPQGAAIVSAYVQFKVDETPTSTAALNIQGQAIDSAPAFTTAARSISSRARTTASVFWVPPPWTTVGEAGPNQRTPDLAPVIQEIVNRPGWASGNALVLIVTGTGTRIAESYNGDAPGAPLLHIVYGQAPINAAPNVNAGTDQTVNLPQAATLNGTVTDDDLPNPPAALTTTWSMTSGPAAVVFADASAVDTTATFMTAGTYVLRLTADDSALNAYDELTVTVNPEPPVNQAPTVNAGIDQTVTLPQTATLVGTVTDDGLPDPPAAVTTVWSMVTGPAAVIFANPAAVNTTATFAFSGTYVFRLTADDGDLNAFDELTVTVNPEPPANQAPTVNAGIDQTITLPQTATLIGTATDDGLPNPPAAVTTVWSMTSGPAAVTFGNPAAVNTTATFSTAGTYILRLTANDSALSAYDELVVTVNPQPPVNQPPTVNAGIDQTVTLPQTATLIGTATDDGLPNPPAALTTVWSMTSGPAAVTFGNPAAVNTTATFSTAGTYVLRLTANDSVLSAYDELVVTVNPQPPTNQPPTVNAGIDQTVTLPQTATLIGTATDDGLPNPPAAVTTVWSMTSGPAAVTFGNPAAVNTTATFSTAGTYVLRLTANDSALSAYDELVVTVNPQPPTNQPPTVNAGIDQTVTLPQTATLIGTATDDGLPNPPAALTTVWSMTSGPAAVTFGNPAAVDTTATFSTAGTYILRLTASDSALSAYDELTVTVNPTPPVNQPPTVNAGIDQTVTLPNTAALDGTVTDDGLPGAPAVLTTLWSMTSGPAAVTFGNPAAVDTTATFTIAGTYFLRLTANDGALSAYDELAVTVSSAAEQVTVDVRVATSSDDAEESLTGSVDLASTDLELIYDKNNQVVGIRFPGVAVPQDATIVSSYVQFKVDEKDTVATFLTIQGQAIDNAPTFTASSGNISSRIRTSAAVLWSPPAWNTVGAAGTDQRTPDLSPVIQEIVSRPGWASGNAIVLIVTGSGTRTAESFNGDAPGAPLLHLVYTTGGGGVPVNKPPTVYAGTDETVSLPQTAALAGTVVDDGLPGPPLTLSTLWSMVSGPAAVAFANPAALDTTATFSTAGTYVLRLTANDGALSAYDELTVTVLDAGAQLTVEVRVAISPDDAEESATGSVDLASTDLELVYDKSTQVVGIRFPGINVPKGATIVSSYVQFQVDEKGTAAASLTFRGQAIDNAPTFTTASGNISSRARTTAAVLWTPPAWNTIGAAGADQRTPDLSPVIQEIVNRPGWASGNAMVLIVTGSGTRTAESFNGDTAGAPLLHIVYRMP